MNIIKELIIKQINGKNKKRKTQKNKCKKHIRIMKTTYKKLNPTNIAKLFMQKSHHIPDIYVVNNIKTNKAWLKDVAIFCQNKLNSQIMLFRSVKTHIFIDYIAKDCVFYCFKHKTVRFMKYIDNTYGFNNLQIKERRELPYLLIYYLYQKLINLLRKLRKISIDIGIGAKIKHFVFWQKYSLARVYGIAKYNQNLLKYIKISHKNIKKCIFDFMGKLDSYKVEIDLLIELIKKVIPYTTFSKRI